LWKNIAQSENNAEIQGLFANVKKNFGGAGKIFSSEMKTGRRAGSLTAKRNDFA
jgi:hypothetical protein